MTLSALFVRFTLIYIAILGIAAVVLNVLGVKGNSGINTAALLGAVMWVCLSFARKNNRYFSKEEKTRVVLGILAIDVILQIVLAIVVVGAGTVELTMGPMVIAMTFVGLIHAAVIYFFVGMAGKQYARQVAKGE